MDIDVMMITRADRAADRALRAAEGVSRSAEIASGTDRDVYRAAERVYRAAAEAHRARAGTLQAIYNANHPVGMEDVDNANAAGAQTRNAAADVDACRSGVTSVPLGTGTDAVKTAARADAFAKGASALAYRLAIEANRAAVQAYDQLSSRQRS